MREVVCLLVGHLSGLLLYSVVRVPQECACTPAATAVVQPHRPSGPLLPPPLHTPSAPSTPALGLPPASLLDTSPFDLSTSPATSFDFDVPATDDFYTKLLAAQLDLCGPLCALEGRTMVPGEMFPTRVAPMHCAKLYASDFFEKPSPHWPPPQFVPGPMSQHYTLNGAVRIKNKAVVAAKYSGGAAMVSQWTKAVVDNMVAEVLADSLTGNYGRHNVDALRVGSRIAGVKGRHVLVIGSENPWVEAIMLAEGAAHVYTLEYGAINSTHPNVTTYTPLEFNQMYRNGTLPKLNMMATFSSLEHSGLGRYGDMLNPWGDVVQMAKTWCVLEPGSPVVVGVEGRVVRKRQHVVMKRDGIWWNLHRQYGMHRFPLLFTNFEITHHVPGSSQPLFIARRLEEANRTAASSLN